MARGAVGTGPTQVEPFDVRFTWMKGVSKQSTGFSLRRNAELSASPQEVADHVTAALIAPLAGILSNSHTILGVDVVKPLTKEGSSISYNAVYGTNSGEQLPSFCQIPAALKGELRARYGQGRMLLPCALESFTTGDALSAAGTTALQAFITALRTTYVTGGVTNDFILINWHPLLPASRPHKRPEPLEEVPASYYDVTSIRLGTIVSSLNSRKQGVGS